VMVREKSTVENRVYFSIHTSVRVQAEKCVHLVLVPRQSIFSQFFPRILVQSVP
jgi:hypothetical protein